MSLNESIVEDAALTWFGELGYALGIAAVVPAAWVQQIGFVRSLLGNEPLAVTESSNRWMVLYFYP